MLLGACATVETSTPVGEDRAPLGKADNIGSCQSADTDFCGGQSDGTCWCDDFCEDFGDCCGDKAAVCDDADVDMGTLCLTDDACGDDQVCDHSECLSGPCPPGFACPAVCFGECKDAADDDGDNDQCGDGTPALCAALPPECPDGQFSPVINHCWGPCVDVDECFDPPPFGECTDGSVAICEIVPPTCPEGTVVSVQNGCFGPCVDPETCEPPAAEMSCEEIEPALAAETAEILSCTSDDQCGQVLAGTSCGCTRNMVARLDADISEWESLREDFFAQECGFGPISTCDCPLVDGFACIEGSCTWNYL